MSKVKRFSLEERYGYQNRKVIYDKNADNDIELNNIYPIIDLLNQLYEQISDLEAKLAEKDIAIENWQTMYESVVQTCHNDKEEIERLNKKLETQENIITNLVEDNRASQEWHRKQLAEKDKEIEYQESMKILAVENQNKKAIEQLEKVKGLIANHTQELWTCENDDIDVVLYEEIDKQIKEIQKGEE